jgi:hypothetical protein
MKTFEFSVTYHYEDSGTIEALTYEDAMDQIENDMAYVCTAAGFSDSWSWVKIDECYEIADDGEDEEDD